MKPGRTALSRDPDIGPTVVAFRYSCWTTRLPIGRFRLTNPAGYSLTYNGLVMTVEKRRSHGWQVFGSYTYSRATGLLPSSGATAAGPQVSTVSPPQPVVFGR